MSRVLRSQLLYKDCYAHVISRSIRKLKLFHEAEDFRYFKQLLIQAKQKAKFKIFHYCLMQTHFHLVVRMGELNDFSFAIRDIKRDYAFKFHSKYKLSGPIWRDRFKSLLIENENYLYACGKYIEDNPVKAQLVEQRIDWAHSSGRYYELNEADELIDAYANLKKQDQNLIFDQREFERGSVIGSDFFKFQFFKNRNHSRPVPNE